MSLDKRIADLEKRLRLTRSPLDAEDRAAFEEEMRLTRESAERKAASELQQGIPNRHLALQEIEEIIERGGLR